MRKIGWHLFAYVSMLVICLTNGGAQSVPAVTLSGNPSPQIVLSQFVPSDMPGFGNLLAVMPEAGGLPGFLVNNGDLRNVVGIAVKWTFFDSSGAQKSRTFKSHSFISPGFTPLIAPQQRLLVMPEMFVQEPMLRNRGIIVAVPSRNVISEFSSAQKVSAEIDSVIFDDGEILGPNLGHLHLDIQARKDAADIVVNTIHDAALIQMRAHPAKPGVSPTITEVHNFVAALDGHLAADHPVAIALGHLRTPSSADQASRLAARFSRQLLQTDYFKGLFDYFSNIPTVPTFHRKDGASL